MVGKRTEKVLNLHIKNIKEASDDQTNNSRSFFHDDCHEQHKIRSQFSLLKIRNVYPWAQTQAKFLGLGWLIYIG